MTGALYQRAVQPSPLSFPPRKRPSLGHLRYPGRTPFLLTPPAHGQDQHEDSAREFLQLADSLDTKKHKIGGFYVSEKLDGTRAFWDGGITRGLPTASVPWASVADPKTGDRKAKIKPVSTGLWSRYGNPIMAPDWS